MPKDVPSKKTARGDVYAYMGKAEEYLDAAHQSLARGQAIAATSLAIHAGINAADAITGARMGQRSSGQHHEQALTLLRQAGKDGKEAARHLQRLLPLKTRAEYEPDPIPNSQAQKAIQWADNIVAIARRVVASLPRP